MDVLEQNTAKYTFIRQKQESVSCFSDTETKIIEYKAPEVKESTIIYLFISRARKWDNTDGKIDDKYWQKKFEYIQDLYNLLDFPSKFKAVQGDDVADFSTYYLEESETAAV